jgi:hypothetical protein
VEQGANFPHPTVEQGANSGYTQAQNKTGSQATVEQGANKTGQVRRLYTGRVRTSLRLLSGGVRTSQGKGKVKGLSFWLDNIQIC